MKRFIALIIVLILTFPVATSTGNYSSFNTLNILEKNHETVLSGSLIRKLIELRTGIPDNPVIDSVEVIIQFEEKIYETDIDFIKEIGGFNLTKSSVMPVLYAVIPASSLQRLEESSRIFYVQENLPLELYLDASVDILRARDVWHREVFDMAINLPYIDGSGVTVAVVDSGIDGTHPDLYYGKKVIKNVKSDHHSIPWVEMINTDITSGHGTHVAGIVAGTGQASAGKYRGVAPGASLIGISMGERGYTFDEFNALQWVYENTIPGNNIHNIRVFTNSWGPGAGDERDPRGAIQQIIKKIVYENNVVGIFAAGNDRGTGEEVRTSPYGNVPAAISVAAGFRDSYGITSFSSKGLEGDYSTYPDITAPGFRIWAARTKNRHHYQGGYDNPWYRSTSGTSMAAPHIAGVVALMWQAAPSMRVSDVNDDTGGHRGTEIIGEPIHEAELILKLTSNFMPSAEGNYIPEKHDQGINGRPMDYSQGYGMANAEEAVGLALTLEKLRRTNPEATVFDALGIYKNVMYSEVITRNINTVYERWTGEYIMSERDIDSQIYPTAEPQIRRVYIPEDTGTIHIYLHYEAWGPATGIGTGDLNIFIDTNGDGKYEWTTQGISIQGYKYASIDASSRPPDERGKFWDFHIMGYGRRNEYSVTLKMEMRTSTVLPDDCRLYPVYDAPSEITITRLEKGYQLGNAIIVKENNYEMFYEFFTLAFILSGLVAAGYFKYVRFRRHPQTL